MLAHFKGGGEVCNAYEAALTNTSANLIIIKQALGSAATAKLDEIAVLDGTNARTDGLKDVLYNELDGLAAAETMIEEWAGSAELPGDVVAIPSLEAQVEQRRGSTPTHFDNATVVDGFINGPFAVSIGTSGTRFFRGLRFPRRLSDEEILGIEPSPLRKFAAEWTHQDRFDGTGITKVRQSPGDMVLIPASPHPALHGVEVKAGVEATSVISSYILAPNRDETPAELRQLAVDLQRMERQFVLNGLIKSRS